MKCPGCGCERADLQETCASCGCAGLLVEMLDDDAIAIGEDEGPFFRIDDDLFEGSATDEPEAAPVCADPARDRGFWPADGGGRPGPVFEPIIDRDEEVPERFWAPEVAGLDRRALALLVDLSLQAAILGAFFLGALLALRLNGFDTDAFLGPAGLQASVLPFALLAAGLSLAYSVFFHGSRGRTPGKALVGIEVRTGDGGALSWGRAILRWFGAALALACAGVGVIWALFEPRRRGWADLLSGTLVARTQRERGPGPDPRVRADPAAEDAFQPLKNQDIVQEARCGRGQASLEASIALSSEQRLG